MRRFFFLAPEISYSLLGISIWAFFKLPLILEIPILLFTSFILYVSRRSRIPYRDTIKNDGEIYLSPVHGTIESVRYGVNIADYPSPCNEVRISVSFWDEKGLYLPTSGEASYLKANKGKRLPRKAPTHAFYGPVEELAHTDLTLTSKNQSESLMRFIDSSFAKRPTIWLKSGDRGRGAACFGYYPFGGTLLIYLPETSDILVFEHEKIVPGQTVIAALKDLPKG
jgi:phosphatidylserine decarboxylase